MTAWLDKLRQWLPSREKREQAEVDRIAALQQAAKQARAENAQAPTSGRGRVEKAEAEYAAAIQAWDEKQFRRRP